MRARFAPLGADRLTFTFEGKRIEARKGETVAAALTAAGILSLRRIRSGGERGLFCGMGVCQDCLVQINGTPSRRACMTKVESGMQVEGQGVPCAKRVKVPSRVPLAMPRRCDVLVVGGGPAGLSAAITAAETGVKVMLVDERPVLGGQFYKQPISELDLPASRLADAQFSGGRSLIARARAAEVHFVNGVVFSAGLPASVAVDSRRSGNCSGEIPSFPAKLRPVQSSAAAKRSPPVPLPIMSLPVRRSAASSARPGLAWADARRDIAVHWQSTSLQRETAIARPSLISRRRARRRGRSPWRYWPNLVARATASRPPGSLVPETSGRKTGKLN